MDAVYRMQPARRLRPNASHLISSGHQNLITHFGPLDVRGTIGRGLGYAELLPHTIPMEIGAGIKAAVLDLDTIVDIKEELAGEKDLATLPVLRRTLEQQRRRTESLQGSSTPDGT